MRSISLKAFKKTIYSIINIVNNSITIDDCDPKMIFPHQRNDISTHSMKMVGCQRLVPPGYAVLSGVFCCAGFVVLRSAVHLDGVIIVACFNEIRIIRIA
jgi:hypothetical protein